jgi:hypothetical protein
MNLAKKKKKEKKMKKKILILKFENGEQQSKIDKMRDSNE